MKKYLIEKLKVLSQLFVGKWLFLVTGKFKYIHCEYYGKWADVNYGCEVVKTQGTLDEIVAIIVAKF